MQSGLTGPVDGSVSTLAPIVATAFATQDTRRTFIVGTAASPGVGISTGLTEVASDDGVVSRRGSPAARGLSAGLMTTIGTLGHTLPDLSPRFPVAPGVAIVEPPSIVSFRNRSMRTPVPKAVPQVIVFTDGTLLRRA